MILGDFRHAFRLFGRKRGFTVAIMLTLALGIGANTAIFSLVRAVLLRPLPYHEPDRLVFAWTDRAGSPGTHERHGILTGAYVIEWHRRASAFESIAVIDSWSTSLVPQMDLVRPDGAERLRGAFVTPNFFELLGVRAAIGRTFDSRDESVGTPLIVVSDAFWRHRLGAGNSVVGQSLDLVSGRATRSSTKYTIVGVLPPEFRFTYPLETEVWAILPWTRIAPSRALSYQMVGRLKAGATDRQAQAELTPILQDIARGYGSPESSVRQNAALVETLPEHVAAETRPGVFLLMAGAGVVMLIACANVALLLLALIADRRREIALRSALDGTRLRIVRQMLAETSMLAGAGAVLGFVLAWLLMPTMRALVPPMVPRSDEMSLDWSVLAFTGFVTVVTALACGLAPAWHAGRKDVQDSLRRSSGSATGDRTVAGWRRAVVAAQISVVFALLIAASLLLHSFWRMQQVDLGFAARGLITMEMRLLNTKYHEPERLIAFQQEVLERTRALPEVDQATMTSSVPLRGVDFMYYLRALGSPQLKLVNMRAVDPQYFSLMRIPLIAGRLFTDQDDARAPHVVIVSAAYGRSLFGDESPLGRRLELPPEGVEIVGVVGDVRHVEVTKAATPALYLPRPQHPIELICLVVRPVSGATGVPAAVRSAVQSVDPEQPVEKVTTLDRIVRDSTAEERFYTVSTAGFAVLVVLLAIAGLAGVVSRTVTERAREIAIRMSLGAQPRQLVRLAVGQGMAPVAIGLVVGALGAWAASRVLARFLFEVSPVDPLTYGAAALVLTAASLAACYVPARRATLVEPVVALKVD